MNNKENHSLGGCKPRITFLVSFLMPFLMALLMPLLMASLTAVSPVDGAILDAVVVDDNAYKNVYVALSPDLPEVDCNTTVANLQEVLNMATSLLYNMTGRRLHFDSTVELVVPSTYSYSSSCFGVNQSTTPGRTYHTAPIRLGQTDPLFGDNPWTQQPRQCGGAGDHISLTPTALAGDKVLAARQLVGEWAKYRWGVMGETGHEGDRIFPPAYDLGGAGSYHPTGCSDAPLNYTEPQCSSEDTCTIPLPPALNTASTASVISLPQLPNVVQMCTSTTHNSVAPTKQNLLCSGRSATEIFFRHSDYEVTPSLILAQPPPVTISVVRETPVVASVVFVVEDTVMMSDLDYQLPYLVDALCQSVAIYLQDGINFAVVSFSTTATVLWDTEDLTILTEDTKKQLCQNIRDQFHSKTKESTRSIKAALTKATEILPPESTIVLITTLGAEEDLSDAVTAAGDNSVWPVVYPVKTSDSLSWYQDLASRTGGAGAAGVEESLSNSALQSVVRQSLSDALQGVISSNQPRQLTLGPQNSCITNPNSRECSVTLPVGGALPAPSTPTSYVISVYYAPGVTYVATSATDCRNVTHGRDVAETSRNYVCKTLPSTVTVTVTALTAGYTVYVEVVLVQQPSASNVTTLELWASDSLRNLRYTETTAPGLFARVVLAGRQVVMAAVSVQVAQEGKQNSTAISMKDDGTGADVTGNDGIYSAFLSGVSSDGSGDQAVTLTVTATGPALFLPTELLLDPPNHCCGSKLILPEKLEPTGAFLLTATSRSKVTSLPPPNLPPGRVKDLSASTVGGGVRLAFTAPGADLDTGMVSVYLVNIYNSTKSLTVTHNVSTGLVSSGFIQSIDIPKQAVVCDTILSYIVVAVDEHKLTGNSSNAARYSLSCSAGGSPLSTGAITGIVIACVLLLVLICLFIYIGCNWKRRDKLAIWQCLTCSVCQSEKKSTKDLPYRPTLRSSQTAPSIVTQIRSVEDLYRKPDMGKRHAAMNQKSAQSNPGGDNNGMNNEGFNGNSVDQTMAAFDRQISNAEGSSDNSFSSYPSSSFEKVDVAYELRMSTLQTTLPINNIGIPVNDENFEANMEFSSPERSYPAAFQTSDNRPVKFSVYPTQFPPSSVSTNGSRESPFAKQRLNTQV